MRAGRLIKFSTIGAGTAVRSLFSKDSARQYLVGTLLEQSGIPAKIGQMIAMRTGIKADAPSPRLELPEVRHLIEEQCPALAAEIEEITDHPQVASLSQVHRGRLRSGESVAIKIQFPGVTEEIDSQLDDFLALAARSPARAFGFSRDGWRGFLTEKLREELDYRQEAIYQQEARRSFSGTQIIVPEIFSQFSTARILTQSFEPATSVNDVAQTEIRATAAASLMVEYLASSLFDHRLIHCDLNPGNYGFRKSGNITNMVLYDFGAMQRIESLHASTLARMVVVAAAGSSAAELDWGPLLTSLGFDESKLKTIRAGIGAVMASLLQPFTGDTRWDPGSWQPGREIDKNLGDGRWWFRMAGPPWFLYLMRSVQGWHSGLKTLGVEVDTRPLSDTAKQIADRAGVWTPQRQTPHESNNSIHSRPQWKSSHLKVKVTEGAETVVEVEMPVAAIENLPDLVPDEVHAMIRNRGIDLATVSADLVQQGAPPGVVFEENAGKRIYRVWLEKK
ncbi:MAG: hypothetical protein RIQ81_1904 [Pseudomonadota bacterium]